MATRVVEWKKPYTWGKAISIDENKVISLNLRDENNLIIYNAGDDEIYVDLQLDDEITPTSAFPIWVNVGRVIVDNWWDLAWTIISAETTSGDNIKIFYADEWTLWIDNWTGTFKQIYFKADVDALLLALRNYIDWELAKKQNWVSSDTAPSNPSEWDLWYDTTNSAMKVWDWTAWQSVGTGGGWDVLVSSQPNNILQSWMKIRAWTEWDYGSLGVYDNNTVYLTVAWAATPWWHPWANTIAYYPLETDADDQSWNWNDATNSWATFTTVDWVDCASFTSASTKIYLPTLWTLATLTVSVWFKTININPSSIILQIAPSTDNKDFVLGCSNWTWILSRYTWVAYNITDWAVNDWTWHNMVGTYTSSWWAKLYVDWVYIWNDSTVTTVSWDSGYSFIWWHQSGGSWFTYIGYISNVILEDKEWTSTEVSDYYNETKWDYWIS